jgi:hypothetical protein
MIRVTATDDIGRPILVVPAADADTARLDFILGRGLIVNCRRDTAHARKLGLRVGFWLEGPDTGFVQKESFANERDAIDAARKAEKEQS